MRVIPLAVYGVWHGGALARGIAGFLHFHASPSATYQKLGWPTPGTAISGVMSRIKPPEGGHTTSDRSALWRFDPGHHAADCGPGGRPTKFLVGRAGRSVEVEEPSNPASQGPTVPDTVNG